MTILKNLSILILLLTIISCGQQKEYVSYKIKKGDTVEDIAKRHKISEKELVKINPKISEGLTEDTYIVVPKVADYTKKASKKTDESIYKNTDRTEKIEKRKVEERRVIEENVSDNSPRYLSYTVKKGETMKEIASRYNISEEELLNINQGVSRNPSENTYILVPINKQKTISHNSYPKKVANEVNTVTSIPKNGSYTVEQGDTLYSLSKRFGVSIDKLKEYNPALKDGLKAGMNLVFHKAPVVKEKTPIITGYEFYEVVKGDTIYNLTRRYNISAEELKTANPELVNGLKLGMTLKIPKKST